MTAKHTPGPWEWHRDRYGYRSISNNTGVVLTLSDDYPGYAECGEELVCEIEDVDAALITAAPDLLDKLAELVARVELVKGWEGIASRVHGIDLDPARDAIKRARGLV